MTSEPEPTATDVTLNTRSGREITPFDPRAEQITLGDIAHGTAQVCRCSGQTAFFYSVALHSLYVSDELAAEGRPPRVRLLGLLHDASEAYIADVPGPVKRELPRYREAEARIQRSVYESFGLERPDPEVAEAIDRADGRLRRYELPALLPAHDWEFGRPALEYDLEADSTVDVPGRFVERARTLLGAIDDGG